MEYKGIKVIKKPWLSHTAQAIFPYIFVPEKFYNNLFFENPNPRYIAILEHEKKHLERQKEMGLFNFGLRYLLSPSFRLKEELIAIKESMKYLKEKEFDFDFEKNAKWLSSWLYLWMVPYERVKRELEKVWEEIK